MDKLKDDMKAKKRKVKEEGFMLEALALALKYRRESADQRNLRKEKETTADKYLRDLSKLQLNMFEPQDFDEDEDGEDDDYSEAA